VVPVLDLKIATHRLRELVEAKVNGSAAREFLAAWKAKAHELKDAASRGRARREGAFPIDVDERRSTRTRTRVAADPRHRRERGMDLDAVCEDFKARMGGLLPGRGDGAELQDYLTKLEQQGAAA
jgi:hypothetical protein